MHLHGLSKEADFGEMTPEINFKIGLAHINDARELFAAGSSKMDSILPKSQLKYARSLLYVGTSLTCVNCTTDQLLG